MSPTSVEFGALNTLALGAYLIDTLSLGLWFARRNRNTTDYFSAGLRIPWWVIGISISNVSRGFGNPPRPRRAALRCHVRWYCSNSAVSLRAHRHPRMCDVGYTVSLLLHAVRPLPATANR